MASSVAGFGAINLSSIVVNGTVIEPDFQAAITDMFLQRNLTSVSTLTIQMADPYRKLLNNLLQAGASLSLDGLSYTLVQTMKASDQIQLVFESTLVHKLKLQHGATGTTVGYDITPFFKKLVDAVGGKLVAPDYAKIWPYLTKQAIFELALARGTTADPNENSWTCMSRLASSVGWRLWESAGVIYFGPDEYWLGNVTLPSGKPGNPPINATLGSIGNNFKVLSEFTAEVQLIDFDWSIGQPFGQATATVMLDNFNFNVGEVVYLNNMGPATGYWLVAGTQRDLFMPQATVTLQVPIPINNYIAPTSLPVSGKPMTALSKKLIL